MLISIQLLLELLKMFVPSLQHLFHVNTCFQVVVKLQLIGSHAWRQTSLNIFKSWSMLGAPMSVITQQPILPPSNLSLMRCSWSNTGSCWFMIVRSMSWTHQNFLLHVSFTTCHSYYSMHWSNWKTSCNQFSISFFTCQKITWTSNWVAARPPRPTTVVQSKMVAVWSSFRFLAGFRTGLLNSNCDSILQFIWIYFHATNDKEQWYNFKSHTDSATDDKSWYMIQPSSTRCWKFVVSR